MRRRSCLSAPGGDERKMAKALAAAADEVVLDLEDAVAALRKEVARSSVRTVVSGGVTFGGQIAVRVNAPRTPWCHHDLIMCAETLRVDSVIVPKVESPGDLAFADRLLDGAEAGTNRKKPLRVQALIESAKGLANLKDIAAASPRLSTLILGYADLSASLGRPLCGSSVRWTVARDSVLVAARSAGIDAIDGPYLGIADDDDFRRDVSDAAEWGFDGKWVIHPQQIDTVNMAFTPTAEEIEEAKAVLSAMAGKGAVALDGRMVDEAVAVAARRILSKAGHAS